MSLEECFMCGKASFNLEFFDFLKLNVKMPASKRPIQSVFQHLANILRIKLIFKEEADTCICSLCFDELSEYDSLMVKLLSHQKKLTAQLQSILATKSKRDNKQDENPITSPPILEENISLASPDVANESYIDDIKSETPEEFITEAENVTLVITSMSGDDDDDNDDCETETSDVFCLDERTYWDASNRLPQECVVCGATFRSKLLLQKHVVEKHNLKTFECNICGAVRKDEEYLELHMNIHQGKTELECRYCPKTFSRPTNTLRHMRKHWDKKAFQCEKCGERFSLDNMLYNHRLRHEAEENPIICSICNQSFKSRKTFNHHQLIHKEHRPRHQCPLCPKSFTERYTLKMHMSTHNGGNRETETSSTTASVESVEDFICVICGLGFQSKETLDGHLKDNHDVVVNNSIQI